MPLMSAGKPVTLDDIEDLDEDAKLGVGAIEDFTWKGLLDFATCTECGRCQSQCPAWNTEKPLSPKMLIMDLRDHAFAKAPYILADESARDGLSDEVKKEAARPLIGDEASYGVIDPDVLWSCTNCGACVNQCPVDIEHVDHIIDMRRYQVLVENNFPAELNQLFRGLEGKGNPWNMSATMRMDWAKGLDFEVPVVGEDLESLESVDWLFWVGCAGAYEDRAKKTTRAVAELLHIAGISFGVLGNGETCTGDPPAAPATSSSTRAWPQQNVETLTEAQGQAGRHHLRALLQHPEERVPRLRPRARGRPPHPAAQPAGPRGQADAGRRRGGRREALDHLPRPVLPRPAQPGLHARRASCSRCCPARRTSRWSGPPNGPSAAAPAAPGCGWRRASASGSTSNRTREAVATGADQIAVGCPFCRVMLSDGLTSAQARASAARGGRGPRRRADAAGLGEGRLGDPDEGRRRGRRRYGARSRRAARRRRGRLPPWSTEEPPSARHRARGGQAVGAPCSTTTAARCSATSRRRPRSLRPRQRRPRRRPARSSATGPRCSTPPSRRRQRPPAREPTARGRQHHPRGHARSSTSATPSRARARAGRTDADDPEVTSEPALGSEIPEGTSLFDLGDPEPAPVAAPVAAPAGEATDWEVGHDIPEGQSLFDVGPADDPETILDADDDEPEPEPVEQPKPTSSGETNTPRTDADINEGGSLFDL